MDQGTTLLFGLPGVRVQRVTRADDGSRTVEFDTDDTAAAACPSCGVVSTSVKGHAVTTPKDIPYGESPIMLRWNKTRWRCREEYCPRGSFTESIEEIPPRVRVTGRLGRAMGHAIGDAARSVSEVAASHRVSWRTAHRRFVALAEQVLMEPEPVRVLGIDETRRGKPRWVRCESTGRYLRQDPWDTGFVDVWGSQGLMGQRAGRTSAAVTEWLGERSQEFRDGVEYVVIDPAAVYAAAVRTPDLLPNATLVVDHFHLVAKANDTVTKVRQRMTWDQRSRRGRRLDPEWANRRRLLRGRERMSDSGFSRMFDEIDAHDPSAHILTAYIAKEKLRTLLSTARASGDRGPTSRQLFGFHTWCIDSNVPELITLAVMIDRWWPAIDAFILTGITNAKTEGYNHLVKQVKRSACGFRNVDNSARRIRFHTTRSARAGNQTSC